MELQRQENNVQFDFSLASQKILKFAQVSEKPKRFEHSLRVAKMAEELCLRYGENPQKGYLAGIAHDICKEFSDELLLSLASHDGKPISDLEKSIPHLLHGRAAAVKLERDFGIDDKDILQAVACHTLGGENLCPLAKILYIADRIEPSRPQSSEEYRSKLMEKNLDEAVLAILNEHEAYLASKGTKIAEQTVLFKKSICQKKEK